MKRVLLLFTILMVNCSLLYAQERQVTGKVTDQTGSPLPGLTVQVKGTNTGTATDAAGTFRLSAPPNATLVIRGVGYTPQELALDQRSTLNVIMESSTKKLDELVVTALGIQRSKNELPYAAQEVKGDQVTKTRGNDFVSSLEGQVAGLQVKSNNGMGGSTDVTLRGYKTISHSNQALFVIDGVPVDNANTNSSREQNGFAGYD
ncbi:MAG TPA: carboxypeptidase-like regulatory domain-containing protein, partial [Chitinophagaceae bacterium]